MRRLPGVFVLCDNDRNISVLKAFQFQSAHYFLYVGPILINTVDNDHR
jgi:hypothetical protein